MKTVGGVPARLPYLRHSPSYTGHSRFISTTRKVAWYRKYPRSTCRWHRARLETLVKNGERARGGAVVIYRPSSRPALLHVGSAVGRERKKMLTAVTYLHTRRRRKYHTVSMAIVRRFEEPGGNPQRPSFPTPIVAKAVDLLRGCTSGNFI